MSRNYEVYLEDILAAIQKIKAYTKGLTKNQFLRDGKTIDAVIRNFEIIGEASHRLPDDFRDKHTSVDWFRIIGFRNRIVHDYMGIDLQIVWTIIQRDLDQLEQDIKSISNKL